MAMNPIFQTEQTSRSFQPSTQRGSEVDQRRAVRPVPTRSDQSSSYGIRRSDPRLRHETKVDGNESITTGENDDAGQQLYFRGLSRNESQVGTAPEG